MLYSKQSFLKGMSESASVQIAMNAAKRFMINYKARQLSGHFTQYLKPVYVKESGLQQVSHDIRHQVYCDEMQYLPVAENKLEQDAQDEHSHHCLIQHKGSHQYAGTVRVVYSNGPQQVLPIEALCADMLKQCDIKPSDFPRHQVGEVSRLAVPAAFRRRRKDRFNGAAVGDINPAIYSERELRCFPLIAVGLYLAAANICKLHQIEHVFAMMEPRLAKNLCFLGFSFRQIGPAVNYHGIREPYYGSTTEFVETLPLGFRKLYKQLGRELTHQVIKPA